MDALEIADTCVNDEVEASGLFKIVERTLLLQRAAGAAFTCSIMIQRRVSSFLSSASKYHLICFGVNRVISLDL